jgi:hypothetical protein
VVMVMVVMVVMMMMMMMMMMNDRRGGCGGLRVLGEGRREHERGRKTERSNELCQSNSPKINDPPELAAYFRLLPRGT